MSIKSYVQFIGEQAKHGKTLRSSAGELVENKLYSIDYDEPSKKQERGLNAADKHIKAKGYKVNHDNHDSPEGNKSLPHHKHPDVTYHYGMGDDAHHAFTIHKDGAAHGDSHLHSIAKKHDMDGYD